jgi:ribosomal protein S18 acetylase RimI-like enzyme
LANRGQQELRVAALYIDAPYRHMGYGKAAMMIADKFAQKRHFSVISLNVFDENIVAKKLYSGLGYRVTKTAEGHSEMCKIL